MDYGMEMSAKDLRELAGFGYSALFAYTDGPRAQFVRDAAHLVREVAADKARAIANEEEAADGKADQPPPFYPTATSHALLAFLDIGAFPSRAHNRLNNEDRDSRDGTETKPATWNSRTHAHVTAPATKCDAPYYHDFFARICSDKGHIDWLKAAAVGTSHKASKDEPFLPLVMYGHLIPAAVFLANNLLQTYKIGFVTDEELESLSGGLRSGIDRIRGCLVSRTE